MMRVNAKFVVQAPPYLFPLLILSKRLHSIFVLRLFNDAFAVFFLFVAIFAFQRRMWTLGCIVFSMGVGIKMSLLLAVPGVGLVLGLSNSTGRALRLSGLMGQVQVCCLVQIFGREKRRRGGY